MVSVLGEFWNKFLQTIEMVIHGFVDKDLNMRANGLTYSLLFAVVPLLALVMAIARGFGMASMIQDQLNASWLGETGMVPTIMEIVERYLDTAEGGVFIGVGLLILIWAVYSFFQSVESAFNRVWGLSRRRSYLYQITTYVAILFAIPVLIIVTTGFSIFLNSTTDTLDIPWLDEYRGWIGRLLQFMVAWAVFSWMYWAVPNTRVRMRAALIPGVLMGTIFQLLQNLSIYVLVLLNRTSIVYGAFAMIPILMTWLQWACLLLLLGVQMSYAIQRVNEPYRAPVSDHFPEETETGWEYTIVK